MRKLQEIKSEGAKELDIKERIELALLEEDRKHRRMRLYYDKGIVIPENEDTSDYDSDGMTEHMRIMQQAK